MGRKFIQVMSRFTRKGVTNRKEQNMSLVDLKSIVEWESHWHKGLYLTVVIGVIVLLHTIFQLIKRLLVFTTIPIWGPFWLIGRFARNKVKGT